MFNWAVWCTRSSLNSTEPFSRQFHKLLRKLSRLCMQTSIVPYQDKRFASMLVSVYPILTECSRIICIALRLRIFWNKDSTGQSNFSKQHPFRSKKLPIEWALMIRSIFPLNSKSVLVFPQSTIVSMINVFQSKSAVVIIILAALRGFLDENIIWRYLTNQSSIFFPHHAGKSDDGTRAGFCTIIV